MAQGVAKITSGSSTLPKLFAPDKHAARRFLEFFTANVRNPNTRRAYARVAIKFASWCEQNDINGLPDIKPMHVSVYGEDLQPRLAAPSVMRIAAKCLAVNPASPVRDSGFIGRGGPKIIRFSQTYFSCCTS